MGNPFRYPVKKSGVPNFDPIFSSGWPSSYFDSNPYSTMRNRPGAGHPWMYAAISTIIRNYVQCPMRVFDIADPDTLIEDHPILKLLRRPNPSMSGTNFLEAVSWSILLPTRKTAGGTAFIWGDKGTNFRRGEIPDELWVDNDSAATPALNAQKILTGWMFEKTDTSPYDYGKMNLMLDEVIRVNYFNPYDLNRGLAPGNVLRIAVGQDASASEFNSAFFANNAGLPGFFSSKTPLGKNQLDEAAANFQKLFVGARNAGKPGMIPYDVDYKQLNLSPADAQYLESMGWNRDQVLAAYQVSKLAVQDYEDINMATAKVAKQQLFDNAIQPMNALIMEEMNEAWVEHIDRGQWRLCVDFSGVAALRDDRDLNWKCAEAAVRLGIPPMIALKMNNIPVDDLDEKSMPWLMENQGPNAPFQGDADAGQDGNTKPPKEEDEEKPKKAVKTAKKAMTREEKDALWDDYNEKVLKPGEASMLKDVRRYLVTERNRTLDMVDDWDKAGRDPKGTPVSVFMLDKTHEDMLLRGMMYRHYKSQSERAMKRAALDIAAAKKDVTQDFIEADVNDWIMRRLKFISEINDTTFKGVEERVGEILARSVAEEMTNDETARALREGVRDVYEGRINNSKTIARTETGAVSSYVQVTAIKNAGFEQKAWLASKDEFGYDSSVRPTHRAADEQGPIEIGSEFVNGLSYPMQEGAPASECCNCRCVLMPVAEDDPFQ